MRLVMESTIYRRTVMFQNFKAYLLLLALLVSVSLPSISLGQTPAAPDLVIRFSHVLSVESAKGQMAEKFKTLLEERTKGKIVVEVYPNSEMANDSQVFESILLDNVQMAVPALSKFSIYTKKLQLYDLPFLFKNLESLDKFQNSEGGQVLLSSFTDRGILGHGYLHNGFKQMSATKKMVDPEDAQGVKFRIMNSDVLESQFKAVGADPVKKPFSQVFSLLSAGVLNGQENTWVNMYAKKLYTVQPYITESNHGVLDYMVITSVRFWENLLPDEKEAIQSALKEALVYGNGLAVKQAEKAKQMIIKSGKSKVIQLSDSERQKWVTAMKPVWKKFSADIGDDLIDKAVKSN